MPRHRVSTSSSQSDKDVAKMATITTLFVVKRFLILGLLFVLTVLWILFLFSNISPHLDDELRDKLTIPQDFESLTGVVEVLDVLKNTNGPFVLLFLASTYLFEQTFCIPGSVFLNVLCGALYGVLVGTLLACLLAATGGSLCYLWSRFLARDLIKYYWPSRINHLQNMMAEHSERLPLFLLSLRLFPMSPGWFLNITSPLVGVPLHWFALTMFVGLAPYNYVCVQTGSVLSEVTSLDDMFSTKHVLKMLFVALIVLLPNLIRRRTTATTTATTATTTATNTATATTTSEQATLPLLYSD